MNWPRENKGYRAPEDAVVFRRIMVVVRINFQQNEDPGWYGLAWKQLGMSVIQFFPFFVLIAAKEMHLFLRTSY